MQLLVSHFHFTNSLLTIFLWWYPHQLGTSPQWHSWQYFSNNMLNTCICLWIKLIWTGWVRNSSHSCGIIATLGVKNKKIVPLVLTKVLNSFGQKFGELTDKSTTDNVPMTDREWMVGQWTDDQFLRSCKGYQLIIT